MKTVKVLCFVRYWVRSRNSTRTRVEAVMIKVVKPEAFIVENVFERQMPKRIDSWNDDHIGDKPNAYCLLGFLTEDGFFTRLATLEARIR